MVIWSIRKVQGLAQENITELRKNRRRNSLIDVIVRVVDPLIDEVDEFEKTISRAKNGRFCQFSGDWNFDGGAWKDFCREESSEADSVRDYLNRREGYKQRYDDVVDLLQREVRDMNPSGLRKVLDKVMEDHGVDMDRRKFLDNNAEDIAKSILTKDPVGDEVAKDIFKRWKSEFIFLRQKSSVSEEIDSLKDFVGGIDPNFLANLKNGLKNIKDSYKRKYDIFESDIEKAC